MALLLSCEWMVDCKADATTAGLQYSVRNWKEGKWEAIRRDVYYGTTGCVDVGRSPAAVSVPDQQR